MSHSQCLGGNTRLRDSVNCFKETRAGNCCSPSGTVSSRPGLVGSLNDWIQHSASCKLMPNLHVIVQRFRLHVLSRPGQKFAFTFDIGAIYFLHLKCTAANFRTGSEFTYCIQRSKPNFPATSGLQLLISAIQVVTILGLNCPRQLLVTGSSNPRIDQSRQ